MRLKGRQARFLIVTLSLWCGTRFALHGPPTLTADRAAPAIAMTDAAGDPPFAKLEPAAPEVFAPIVQHAFPSSAGRATGSWLLPALSTMTGDGAPDGLSGHGAALFMLAHLGSEIRLQPQAMLHRATYASWPEGDAMETLDGLGPGSGDAAPAPPTIYAPVASPTGRISGEAYVFVRPGSGRAALSPDGQLAGSQAAMRAAYRLNPGSPVALAAAARLYAPLKSAGAEAAIGIDVHPFVRAPLRVSIERRQRLDHAGRSAWSAYMAGGFYRERHGLVIDGYGQAGLVGLRRADIFVDGALRAGVRVGDRKAGPVLGAGLWGAAQPGVSRIDVGPRAAFRLPIADHGLTIAIEGRFRLAGEARPGSGVAITLAADL